jgi:hypothetical protein
LLAFRLMRRIPLVLLLPLLLALAQHGALLHELSHLSYSVHARAAQAHEDRELADNSQCAACLAFAQVANPGGTASLSNAAIPASAPLAVAPAYRIVAAAAPIPRSRGPPLRT